MGNIQIQCLQLPLNTIRIIGSSGTLFERKPIKLFIIPSDFVDTLTIDLAIISSSKMAHPNGSYTQVQDMTEQQNLIDRLFWTLNNQLSSHNLARDGVYQANYHVTIHLDTQHGPGLERLVVSWNCDYCQALYHHARYLNAWHNQLYARIRLIDPLGNLPRENRTDLINRLRPPFPPVPLEVLTEAFRTSARNERSPEPENPANAQEPGEEVNGDAYMDIWQPP
jgi:hypothetical protein